MEGTGKALIVPTIEELIILNRRLIREYGGGLYIGSDNLANRGSLEHALAQMQSTVFGYDQYPTLFDKAALLAWRIIAGHIFFDGNKRTGMASIGVMLVVNGYKMLFSTDIIETALKIATKRMSIVELSTWIERQIEHTS